MVNKIKNIFELIEYPKEGIISKDILNEDKIEISLFCMSAKTKISDHTTTKKAIVHVVEGSGIFNLKGKEIKMVPGTIIYMDENETHSLRAVKNTSFILNLIK